MTRETRRLTFGRMGDRIAPHVLRALVIAAGVWISVGIIFAASLYSQRVSVQVGDTAPRSVYAPFNVVDYAATDRARRLAASRVPVVYVTDPKVLAQAQRTLADDFQTISELSTDSVVPLSARANEAAGLIPLGVPTSVWAEVLQLAPGAQDSLQRSVALILQGALSGGVRSTSVDIAKGYIASAAAIAEADPGLRLFVTDLASTLLRPNSFPDVALTNERRNQAANSVPLVRVLKGTRVLTKNDVVTPQQYDLLQELGLLNQGFDPGPAAGGLLFGLAVVAVLGGYLYEFRRGDLQRTPQLLITGILTVAGLLAAETLGLPGADFVIVPAAAVMLAALVDPGLAIVAAGVLAFSTGILSGTDLTTGLVSFFGGVAGVVGVLRLSARYDVVRVALLVGVVNLVTLLGLDFIEGLSVLDLPVWQQLAWAFVDGGIASMLAVGVAPFLEAPFGVITAMRLIELTNPNQPLLRKLLIEAPGTYQHAILVGNLAEAATEAVGGNSLLARVGAIYHDIGKTKRPYFFIDNQFGAENPHDKLSPSLSALIISSHVRDGLELAQEHRLPRAIQDFIAQHHGTTLIRYFYERALDRDTGEGVEEADFRYDGPRPQSKETAIVMLADASEATTRTLKNPTAESIEPVVRRIIKERLEDGQLDSADLTLKDLDVIARTFTRILTGVFHQRVEYPDPVMKEIERSRRGGGVGGKPAGVVRPLGGDSASGS
ncbi:MAG: HD family phosphohydrolase, partial [Clostridia bacterium]